MNLPASSIVVSHVNIYLLGGLPLHPLLVHGVVVLVPLTALAVILHAVLPAARRRLGVVTPLAALAVLILVPITVNAGQQLLELVGPTPQVQKHAALAAGVLPWTAALFAVAVTEWLWFRGGMNRVPESRRRVLSIVLMVIAIIVAVGATVDVFIVGEAGSRSVWGRLAG